MEQNKIEEVIQKEISWCEKNFETCQPDVSTEERKGFIKGLKQSLFLIKELFKKDQ